ncbi:MAG: beta-1,6-N-acetylglucosaminyltransferase [Lachnospiraceae bacterium]|nr:beta-1,6-N-acetylglucosaminyltransferase [Lachnospiraceae bacterium]
MKQAYLITAYKDFDQLYELANFFSETAYVLIHVDAKSKSITDAEIEILNRIPGCEAFRSQVIRWGSFTHLEAIAELLVRALKKEDVGYLHLLTGEDYPLFPAKALDERFLGSDRIYMSYIPYAEFTDAVRVRYRYVNLMANRNLKNKLLWLLQDLAGRLQELLGRVRVSIGDIPESRLYKGLVYISMPRDAAAFVIRYIATEGASFWKGLKTCQVPEEFFFQTIFLNHKPFSEQIVDQELRYMDWSSGDGASPVYLGPESFEQIEKAREEGKCFARKFHPYLSAGLREKIRERFLSL